MLAGIVVAAYILVGLGVSRWAWRSGLSEDYADSFEDRPFDPSFVAFCLIWLWPVVAFGPLVRWFYGSRL